MTPNVSRTVGVLVGSLRRDSRFMGDLRDWIERIPATVPV
jgi:hypothetical protein